MSPDETLGRQITGSSPFGLHIARANYVPDHSFAVRCASKNNVLNDLIPGRGAGILVHCWPSPELKVNP